MTELKPCPFCGQKLVFDGIGRNPEESDSLYRKRKEMAEIALDALRIPTREIVERMRGEWIIQQEEHKEYLKKCSKCGFPISGWWGQDRFCANCGTPMTDKAVDMMLERWKEALK